MNEWPDELWRNEPYLTRNTPNQSANDAAEEIDLSAFIIESTVPWAAIGASLILCSSVVMGLLGAMVGVSSILTWRKLRGIGSAPGRTRRSSRSSGTTASG